MRAESAAKIYRRVQKDTTAEKEAEVFPAQASLELTHK
jgi:hypothetical protein